MLRREFLQRGGVAAAVAMTPGCLCSCTAADAGTGAREIASEAMQLDGYSLTIDLGKAAYLRSAGNSGKADFDLPDGQKLRLLVICDETSGYLAYENRCTHGGMRLTYKADYKGEGPLLRCNSFGHSRFGLNGTVMKGPANDDLVVFAVHQNGDLIEIDLRG